jgi:DNA repair protein SbcD/Mre11
MIKLLATADIHLGKRSSHAGDDHASPRHAWNDFVNHAVNGAYDMVLLTGDIVDQDNRYFEGSSILEAGLKILDRHGIHVCVVSGNHDYEVLPLIMKRFDFTNVYLLGAGGKWERKILEIRGQKISVTGWSFPHRHYRFDPLNDLAATLTDADDSDFRIGMVHGDLYDPKSTYAPLSMNSLTASGHLVWFLGHVHKPAMFGSAATTMACYPGSLQALSPKESGSHGALHVELDKGRMTREEQIVLSRTRYETLDLHLTGDEYRYPDSVRQEVNNRLQECQEDFRKQHDRLQTLVLDLNVHVNTDIKESVMSRLGELQDVQEIDYDGLNLRVRTIECIGKIPPADVQTLMEQSSPAGLLARILHALENDQHHPQAEKLEAKIRDQIRSIPSTVFQPVKIARIEAGRPLENEVRTIALRQCREALNRLIAQQNA